jgi:hypothetical protein
MSTGDILGQGKWREYYTMDKAPLLGDFQVGTIIGIYVDTEKGLLNYFKDGRDMGQAFHSPELTEGYLYPFIQTFDLV